MLKQHQVYYLYLNVILMTFRMRPMFTMCIGTSMETVLPVTKIFHIATLAQLYLEVATGHTHTI
jgi:hypothetical protein